MHRNKFLQTIRYIMCYIIAFIMLFSSTCIYAASYDETNANIDYISENNNLDNSNEQIYENVLEQDNTYSFGNDLVQDETHSCDNELKQDDTLSLENGSETVDDSIFSDNSNIDIEEDIDSFDKIETESDNSNTVIFDAFNNQDQVFDEESSVLDFENEVIDENILEVEDSKNEEELNAALPATYQITYILNGGINNDANVPYIEEDYKLVLKKPVREGFVFNGWFNLSNNMEVTSIKNRCITIYAKWTPITYKVTLNVNGGKLPSGVSNKISYTNNSPRIDLPIPTQKYYKFDGWYKDKKYTQKIDYIYSGSIGNLNLYAKWNHIYHDITYYMNESPSDPVILSSKHVKQFTEVNGATLVAPTRKGFTFKGFYAKSPTSIYFSSKDKKITSIPQHTTTNKYLYAWWEENSYKLSFNANGGSFVNKLSSGEYKYTDNIKLPFNTAVNPRVGYKFMGWNTKKDGSGTHYEAGTIASRISTKNNAKVTLYVQWEPIKYGVYCDYRDGSMFDEKGKLLNPTYHTVEKSITLKEPTKKGYIFEGWYGNPLCTGKRYTKISKNPSDQNFYALWSPIKYKIAFDPNGGKGEIAKNMSCKYDVEYEIPDCSYTRKGYYFKEWNTEITGDGKSYLPGDTIKNLTSKNGKKIILYPIWKKNKPVN